MFSLFVKNYENMFRMWIQSVESERKVLAQTSTPIEFQRSFLKLIEHIVYFDSLWFEMEEKVNSLFKGVIRYAVKVKIPKPPYFTFEPLNSEYPDKVDADLVLTEYETLYSILPLSKDAIDLFFDVIQELKESPTQFQMIVQNYQNEIISRQAGFIDELTTKLNKSPPPTLPELYPLLQNLIISHLFLSHYDINHTYPLIDPNSHSYNMFTNAYNRVFSGNDKLFLLTKKSDGKLEFHQFTQTEEFERIKESYISNNEKMEVLTDKISSFAEAASLEPRILQTLLKMDPEFPVFLPRLAELVDSDRELTERALMYVLQRNPEIGKYNTMAQVLKFSDPDKVGSKIEHLISLYGERSYNDLLQLLVDNKPITQHELKSLVSDIFQRLENILRQQVNTEERLDMIETINLSYQQGLINENEQMTLHSFRKTRNEMAHEGRIEFPSDLILATENVIQRLEKR